MKSTITKIEQTQFILVCIIGTLSLLMLGAEPSTFTEDNMYEYQHMFDFGHYGWFMFMGWIISVITYITLSIVKRHLNKSVTK